MARAPPWIRNIFDLKLRFSQPDLFAGGQDGCNAPWQPAPSPLKVTS